MELSSEKQIIRSPFPLFSLFFPIPFGDQGKWFRKRAHTNTSSFRALLQYLPELVLPNAAHVTSCTRNLKHPLHGTKETQSKIIFKLWVHFPKVSTNISTMPWYIPVQIWLNFEWHLYITKSRRIIVDYQVLTENSHPEVCFGNRIWR